MIEIYYTSRITEIKDKIHTTIKQTTYSWVHRADVRT